MPDHAAIAASQTAASRHSAPRPPDEYVTPVFGAYANQPPSGWDKCRLMVAAATAMARPVATTMTVRCCCCTGASWRNTCARRTVPWSQRRSVPRFDPTGYAAAIACPTDDRRPLRDNCVAPHPHCHPGPAARPVAIPGRRSTLAGLDETTGATRGSGPGRTSGANPGNRDGAAPRACGATWLDPTFDEFSTPRRLLTRATSWRICGTPAVPLSIIARIVRRSSSVIGGSGVGGCKTIEVSGWFGGPTVMNRISGVPTSSRTSKPGGANLALRSATCRASR